MTDIEVCTHNHKHRIHDYTKQTHECMTTHKSNTSSVQAQTSLLVSVVCRGMYGRLVEAVPSLKQEPCSLFHCSQYQYVQEEGLVGYYPPQCTTGISPAELLLERRPRTRLDLLKPHTAERMEAKQLQQKTKHNATAKSRPFCVGDAVFVRNYSAGDRWLPGTISRTTGPMLFSVQLEDGREGDAIKQDEAQSS